MMLHPAADSEQNPNNSKTCVGTAGGASAAVPTAVLLQFTVLEAATSLLPPCGGSPIPQSLEGCSQQLCSTVPRSQLRVPIPVQDGTGKGPRA